MGAASMRHPVTGALYTDQDGRVRVEHEGRCGLFREDGCWLEGELRNADPLMCKWIAGHRFGDQVPFRNQRLQANSGMGRRTEKESAE
ncbi:MAG: hypothetical protein AB7S98_25510 [Burkholderiaceae bacterium]